MIEQRARFRRVRDRSIFVGDPDDVVPDTFGPGLPAIRRVDGGELRLRRLRHRVRPGRVRRPRARCGPSSATRPTTSGVRGHGRRLGRRWRPAAAGRSTPCRSARAARADLRFVVVAGPRIDPASLPPRDGVHVHGYVPDLYRHLAACDVAVVQGGLTTCMELTANRRPFVYVPLRHHFEQNFHVRAPPGALRRRAAHALRRGADPPPRRGDRRRRSAAPSATVPSRPTAPPAPPRSSPTCSELDLQRAGRRL